MNTLVRTGHVSARSVAPPYDVAIVSRHVLRYAEPGFVLDVPVELGMQPYGVYLEGLHEWAEPAGVTITADDRACIDRRLRQALGFLNIAFTME